MTLETVSLFLRTSIGAHVREVHCTHDLTARGKPNIIYPEVVFVIVSIWRDLSPMPIDDVNVRQEIDGPYGPDGEEGDNESGEKHREKSTRV